MSEWVVFDTIRSPTSSFVLTLRFRTPRIQDHLPLFVIHLLIISYTLHHETSFISVLPSSSRSPSFIPTLKFILTDPCDSYSTVNLLLDLLRSVVQYSYPPPTRRIRLPSLSRYWTSVIVRGPHRVVPSPLFRFLSLPTPFRTMILNYRRSERRLAFPLDNLSNFVLP